MGTLIDQFCTACEEISLRSPAGQSILVLILVLVGGTPVVDPSVRPDPYFATVAHVHLLLERLIHKSKMTESFLVPGFVRAIDDVLADCSAETPPPGETRHWSLATQRLIQHGLLVAVASEGLALAGDSGTAPADQHRQAEADREMWQELTAPILEEQNLEQAIREESEDED